MLPHQQQPPPRRRRQAQWGQLLPIRIPHPEAAKKERS